MLNICFFENDPFCQIEEAAVLGWSVKIINIKTFSLRRKPVT